MGLFNLVGVIALYIIVPLRHAVFNNNGQATGIMIIVMSVIGVGLGFFFEGKSAWCSGLCPVHPVEKLYGGNVGVSVPNLNCSNCVNCVVPCPDSTPNIHPSVIKNNRLQNLSGNLLVGGLPGFIWGWFHVPDQATISTINTFFGVYQMPMLGFTVSLLLYLLLSSLIHPEWERRLISIFAAAGVSCYYWYRIPSLFGFGNFGDDGLLLDLRHVLPGWSLTAITTATTLFFFYWLVIRKQNNNSWVIRPQYAGKQ